MDNEKRGEVVVSALQFACTDDVSTNLATAERSHFLIIFPFPFWVLNFSFRGIFSVF